MSQRRVPDDLDLRILDVLARDARTSFRAIARALGISTPTVAQRVKRMEGAGVIRGYRVETAIDRTRAAEPRPDWECGLCKGPILVSAYTRTLGGKTYAFCCTVCRDDFARKYKHVSRQTDGAKKRPLPGLVPWFAAATAAMLGMLGTCSTPGHMVQASPVSCVGCLPPPAGSGAFSLPGAGPGGVLAVAPLTVRAGGPRRKRLPGQRPGRVRFAS